MADDFELAFGLTRQLRMLKKIVPQALDFADLEINPGAPDFTNQLGDAMRAAVRIHFNLTGMRDLNRPNGVLRGSATYNDPGSTNWELRTIWDGPLLRAKTIFYPDGKTIAPEDVGHLP